MSENSHTRAPPSADPRNLEPLVEAARGGDEHALRALVEPLGRELHAYAYHDADDALQESRLEAWRALATYEPRASFRAWMYRIVTNTCLDLLKARSRRVLPHDVSPPVAPGPPTTAPRDDLSWIEPYPDALLPAVPSPEHAVRLREGIRLAFVRVAHVADSARGRTIVARARCQQAVGRDARPGSRDAAATRRPCPPTPDERVEGARRAKRPPALHQASAPSPRADASSWATIVRLRHPRSIPLHIELPRQPTLSDGARRDPPIEEYR